jgi:hypothetical protein
MHNSSRYSDCAILAAIQPTAPLPTWHDAASQEDGQHWPQPTASLHAIRRLRPRLPMRHWRAVWLRWERGPPAGVMWKL